MSNTSVIHKTSYTIRTYEVDQQKRATPPALLQLMHEAAMENVIQLKLSVWDLEKQQLSWVLMRMNTTIHQLPCLGDTIYVETYPAGFEKLITYRDYRIFDAEGQLIAETSSAWLLMDTEKRRMVRIPAFMHDFKLPDADSYLPRPTFRVPKFEHADWSNAQTVNWFDLDFNGHLSNVSYVRWLLETMDAEVLKNKILKKFSISYKQECHLLEKVVAETQKWEEGKYLHRLVRERDDKVVALAVSEWRLVNGG